MADEIIIETTTSEVIEVGVVGPQGASGQGVPVGGTTGQVLRKASGTNYDTEWAAAASGSGSVTSVALAGAGLTISGSPVTTSGTITANVVYGTTAGTAAEGNDSRFVTASTTTPAALGTAAVGTGTTFARADHVHSADVLDSEFRVVGSSDATKKVAFEVDSITTGTVRTLTVPNASGMLGWLQSVSSITVSADYQLTAARNQRVLVNSTNAAGGSVIYLPSTGTSEGDRLEVACVGLTSGTLSVQTGQYDFTVSTSMGLNTQRTFIYSAGAWSLGSVEFHTHTGLGPTFGSSVFRVTEPGPANSTNLLAFSLANITAGETRTLTIPNRSGTVVVSDTSAGSGSDVVNNIVSLTQAEYNAIGSPDAATLYLITDP